jgi:Primase C terminal 2 (PriCT-2)
MGLRIFAATGGEGFELFDAFSKKSDKYDAGYTQQRWEEITGSPPNRTGDAKIFKIAREHGWVAKQRKAEPTYPAPAYSSSTAASTRYEKSCVAFWNVSPVSRAKPRNGCIFGSMAYRSRACRQ